MVLRPWLRKLVAPVLLSKRGNSSFFLNEHDFRFEIARECIRADRSGAPVSVLVIELPPEHSSNRDDLFLSRLLQQRLRITDTPGTLDVRRFGVLLPETPEDGAWKVVEDICDF